MKKLVGALAVLCLVIGAVALWAGGSGGKPAASSRPKPVPAPTEVAYSPPPIEWLNCAKATGQAKFKGDCGYLSVPLDYAHPAGAKIKIAVSRVEHTTSAAKYQGVMLVNPGGPGEDGLPLSQLGQSVPGEAGQAYDWIGFDPRGVGWSRPRLSCDDSYNGYDRPAYVPATAALEKTWLDRSKTYAADCEKAGGALLGHMKSVDTVDDMDSLRKALGREQINYFGYSYGTYLGQVYSTLFPTRVRRMVLDGVVDPRFVWYQDNLHQDVAFDQAIKIYFTWVAKYDRVYHLGSTEPAVEKFFYAEQAKLTKKPAGGKIGGDELNDIVVGAGYTVFGWLDITKAVAGYVHDGEWKPLQALYAQAKAQGKGSDNTYAVYLAVQCTDAPWPRSVADSDRDNAAVNLRAPFETWNNAWFNAPCLYWPAKPAQPVAVDGQKAPPALLISETYDAATPYSGALEVRRRYPRSVLLEGVGGSSHAASLSGVPCTDNTIAAYLSTGTLPKRLPGNRSDKQCPPNPQPRPSGG
jgi:pimeloyl-ACP methyl ester carboxylesterase